MAGYLIWKKRLKSTKFVVMAHGTPLRFAVAAQRMRKP